MDEKLQQLLDKQDCTELVYNLSRGLDRLDADLLRSVLHPNATDDHGVFKGGRDEYIEWSMRSLATMDRTQHAICNVIIEVNGDEARGESYVIATHDWYDDGIFNFEKKDASAKPVTLTTGGRYLDSFQRRNGVWKISHRHAVWEWQTWQPRTDRFPRNADDPQSYGERGTSDLAYAHFAQLVS